MPRGTRTQARTYRGYRLDIREDLTGGWNAVIHPPVGLPGRIATLREPSPYGLPGLIAAAQAHVDHAIATATLEAGSETPHKTPEAVGDPP